MTDVPEIEIPRDSELEAALLAAIVADRNDQPRSKQVQVGPSSIGGCRELLRAGLFEGHTLAEPETHWATAAFIGSVAGEALEKIFGQRLGALEQQRMTTLFERLGLQISGAIDLMFIDRNQITDLKSTGDMGGLLYDLKKNAGAISTLLSIHQEGLLYNKGVETPDGGYELTEAVLQKVSKLHYYVQVAVYVTGAMQAGILSPGAEGRLVFYDRGGSYQEFVAVKVSAEEIALFYDIAQHRIEQVAQAQAAYEATSGNPATISHLRDMTPSYCFSPKVMCPRRAHCWMGSDWTADNRITNPDQIAAVERYAAGRDMANMGDAMKRAAREELRGIEGVLPDGKMVTWVRGGSTINIVETTKAAPGTPKPKVEAEPRTRREVELKKLLVPALRMLLESDYDLPTSGTKAELIQRVLNHEFGGGEPPAEPLAQLEESVVNFVPPEDYDQAPDPDRPGLLLGPDETQNRLRQMQYDADSRMRERLSGGPED